MKEAPQAPMPKPVMRCSIGEGAGLVVAAVSVCVILAVLSALIEVKSWGYQQGYRAHKTEVCMEDGNTKEECEQ